MAKNTNYLAKNTNYIKKVSIFIIKCYTLGYNKLISNKNILKKSLYLTSIFDEISNQQVHNDPR